MTNRQPLFIRTAQLTDAPSLAYCHLTAWQTAYRGIVPQAYLDSLDLNARTSRWESILSNNQSQSFTLVAESTHDRRLLGFASAGPNRDDATAADAEIYAIYVLPDSWGQAVGHQLLASAFEELRLQGYTQASVWVFADNQRARLFYERHGAAPTTQSKLENIGDQDLSEVAYFWDNLCSLASPAP